jgi:hypothetical protein
LDSVSDSVSDSDLDPYNNILTQTFFLNGASHCFYMCAAIRVSRETSFVSYFAKYETKQVSCFAKQTCCFAKFCYEAKQAVSHVSLFFKRKETAHFACFVTIFVFHKEHRR